MRDSLIPGWLRLVGWGLLASVLLHWVVLDLIRTAAGIPAVSRTPDLHATLRKAAPDLAGTPPGSARTSSLPASPDTPSLAKPLPEKTRPELAQDDSRPAVPAQQGATISTLRVDGLRSGQVEEAMVALRLALAQSLASFLAPDSISQKLTLWCDFDGAGRVLGVRNTSGPGDAVLLASVTRAAQRLVVPELLAGHPFSLDVLLEPGE